MTNESTTQNQLCEIARQKYGDNAVEALVYALASVVTPQQLSALCDAWSRGINKARKAS